MPQASYLKKFVFLRHSALSLALGAAVFLGTYSCGKKAVESLRGDDTGSVPGDFVVRVAPAFREKIDALKQTLAKTLPSSDFLARFSGDDGSFGLTGQSKLSDIYSIKVPDTGSDSANEIIFAKLKGLTSSGSKYFDNIDTDKYLAVDTYETQTINDPDFNKQYYLEMINWHDAVAAITDDQISNAAKVVVAVLDTGVEAKHEDLSSVMWRDPTSQTITGYDAIADKTTTSPSDGNGHGTHVAGIIGGTGRNGKGIHGVGYLAVGTSGVSNTEIMSVKVLNDSGAGTSEYMVKGVRWAVQQHLAQLETTGRSNQKLILNMSLGGPFETENYDYSLDKDGKPVFTDDVIEYASANNALIIVAAGNESCGISGSCKIFGKKYQKTYYYPCSYNNVLCVAASTHADKLAGFSNRLDSVSIAAPGWQIMSTLPASVNASLYGYYSGTSQATPVTTGAASMLWSLYPSFTAAQIKALLKRSSAQIDAITGEITSKNGRLDLQKALEFAAQLKASGDDPLDEGEVDPATNAKNVASPNGAGDPDAQSTDVDGDIDHKQTCGTIGSEPVTHGTLLTFLVAPLLIFYRRRRF